MLDHTCPDPYEGQEPEYTEEEFNEMMNSKIESNTDGVSGYSFSVHYRINKLALFEAKLKMATLAPDSSEQEKKQAKIFLDTSSQQVTVTSLMIIIPNYDYGEVQDVLIKNVLGLNPDSEDFKHYELRITSIMFTDKVFIKLPKEKDNELLGL